MSIRKIAAASGFAVGAALAFAPLAAAEPVDITSTIDSEISSMNSSFDLEALLGGDYKDVVAASASNPYDTVIPTTDVPDSGTTPTTFGEELFGVDSIANATGDPGAYDLFNGATGQFDNAFNVELYGLENNGALIAPGDLLQTGHVDAFDTGTVATAFENFYNWGVGDLGGYFGTDLSFLDITATQAGDITTFLTDLSALF